MLLRGAGGCQSRQFRRSLRSRLSSRAVGFSRGGNFGAMEQRHGGGMYSPASITSSSSSSSSGSVSDSDEFGLRMLIYGFYAPYLVSELERLFVTTPLETNSSGNQAKSVWEDFENNGQERDLDDLDRLLRGMDAAAASAAAEGKQRPSVPQGVQPAVHLTNAVEDILTQASLIEILRERERLQRSRAKKLQKKPNATRACVFCRNNGEPEAVYSSHHLKDPEGNITCPILYIYTCPICGANGKSAHTIKYCPYNTGEPLQVSSSSSFARSKAFRPFTSKYILPLI